MRYVAGLGLASAVSLGLVLVSSLAAHQFLYPYLIWNLFLAWLPLLLAYWLVQVLRRKLWSSWEALAITIAWLAFLPNSFYMVSDFIHLNELSARQLLVGSVTFTAFVFTGLCLGVTSLYLVHREFLKRVSGRTAAMIAGLLLLISSVAIYVGRDLRWNSWDVVFNPFGLLFDVSDRLLHPSQYPQALAVILPFFLLLSTIYYVAWQIVAVAQTQKKS